MSEDGPFQAGNQINVSKGNLIRLMRPAVASDARHSKREDPPAVTRDGPLAGANEGEFASIPAVGTGAFALILGVIALILLAIIVSCVAARKPDENAHAASFKQVVCLMARMQNGPKAQDPAGDPCVR